jgi:hypothetical protein
MKRRLAVLLLAAVGTVGLYATPARAGTHAESALVVGDCQVGRHHHHHRYDTIQAAVDAADPGDLIRVCPGTYEENVKVTKPCLTIEGAKAGVDARWRDQTTGESKVTGELGLSDTATVQLLADDITWDGFLVADNGILVGKGGPGVYTSPEHSGYRIRNTVFNDNGVGVYLNSDGKHESKVRFNRFSANNEYNGPGAGSGIYSDQGAQCVLIADNLFTLHKESAILFADGDQTQDRVWVERNKSIDDTSFATFYATSNLHIASNVVSNGRDQEGSAIYIAERSRGVIVECNAIESASGDGITITDRDGHGDPGTPPEDVRVLRNKVRNAKLVGIDVAAPGEGQYEVRGNVVLHSGKVGILASSITSGAVLAFNIALDNGTFDCQDDTGTTGAGTAGTANTWRDDVGDTDQPDGICAQQQDQEHDGKPGHHHKHHKHHHHKDDRRCGCSSFRRY